MRDTRLENQQETKDAERDEIDPQNIQYDIKIIVKTNKKKFL